VKALEALGEVAGLTALRAGTTRTKYGHHDTTFQTHPRGTVNFWPVAQSNRRPWVLAFRADVALFGDVEDCPVVTALAFPLEHQWDLVDGEYRFAYRTAHRNSQFKLLSDVLRTLAETTGLPHTSAMNAAPCS
jgi:hypothetical protein